MPRVYVVAQHPDIHPMLPAFLREAEDTLRGEGKLSGWIIKTIYSDTANSFNPADIFSEVNAEPGPILLLGAMKPGAIAGLEHRATNRVVVARQPNVTDAVDCYEGVAQCIESFESGDPLISKRLLVTVQILTKLKRMDKWGGGSLNKAFLWLDDLPNGGMEPSVQGIAIETAHELVNRGILRKKVSNGQPKIALNTDARAQIDELLTLEVRDRALQRFLAGGPGTVSARLLDQYIAG